MDPDIDQAAEALWRARRVRQPISELPVTARPRDMAGGCAVQDRVAVLRGEAVVGWKIAATSRQVQRMLGVHEPFCGRVFASVLYHSPATLGPGRFHMRGVEGEFVFRLARDLPARRQPYGPEEVIEAVASLHPGIEMVDSGFADWLAVPPEFLVADNAVNGALIVGPAVDDWRSIDLATVRVTVSINGAPSGTGSGADVLGHPLEALTWLANFRRLADDGMRAGQYVTTGTCTGVDFVAAGDRAVARFEGLGEAQLSFDNAATEAAAS